MEEKPHDKLLRPSEAARALGIHLSTLRIWDKDGYIRCQRTAHGHRRVRQSEVDRILEGRPMEEGDDR